MALAATLLRLVASLGNAGAQANAYRACEERKLAEARVEALAVRLSPQPEGREHRTSAVRV